MVTAQRISTLLLSAAAVALLLLLAAPLLGADEKQDRERKVKAALAIAEAESKGKQRTAIPTAPAPREPMKKDYATGHKESIGEQAVLVVYVACDGPKIDGAITCTTKNETFGSVKGPAVVVGYPQGDRLFVEKVLPCPADPDTLKATVRDAGKKINGKGPAERMPSAPKPLDWQIRGDGCICGDACKCDAGKCPSQCPVAVAAAPARVFVGYQKVCSNGVCSMVPVYR